MLSDLVIESIDWDEVEVLGGTGGDLAESLRRFGHAGSAEEMAGLWDELEGVAFAQNTIYGAAVPLAEVMLNRPGVSGDSKPWEGWSHGREHTQAVSG